MAVDTKELLLDTAEKLFAEHGIDAVSLRTIISEAGVNLAAVHYHFGSKDVLAREVFARRVRPINEERLAMLAELESRAGDEPASIEDVLRALFAPPFRLMSDPERGHIFLRLCGRFYAAVSTRMEGMFEEEFREVVEKFFAAFQRALPGLQPAEIAWRMHFAIGALVHTMMSSQLLKKMSGGVCDPTNAEETIERMVSFAAAGMKASVAAVPGTQEPASVREAAR